MTAAAGPVRLAILGATGGIGGHLLSWAADARYPVNVLARDPAAVPRRPGVTVTEGNATEPDAVYEAVASADAVLSALGPRGAKSPDLLATAARHVVQAMSKTGARRLIGVSAGRRVHPGRCAGRRASEADPAAHLRPVIRGCARDGAGGPGQ
jgi:putative NADH-flavin reductase